LRARQAVIVGDQMQLPPTSFFWEGGGEDSPDEDVEDQSEGAESILDLAWGRFSRRRMLQWHYRSKHHSLIAFSNRHFYEDKLLIPPSPFPITEGGEMGLHLVTVEP